jgi:hypothetical protein
VNWLTSIEVPLFREASLRGKICAPPDEPQELPHRGCKSDFLILISLLCSGRINQRAQQSFNTFKENLKANLLSGA